MLKVKGFTLIELMVVIAIIAILTSIGYSIYNGAQKSSLDARRKADIDSISKAYEAKYKPLKNKYTALEDTDFVNSKRPRPPESPNGDYEGFNGGFSATTRQAPSFLICAKLANAAAGTVCSATTANCYCKSSSQGVAVASGAIPTTATGDLAGAPPPTASWLTGYSLRKSLTVSNSGSALTDYQFLVITNTQSLITAGKMRSDCGDVRFTDQDATTLLNYWLESGCNSTTTRLWVKVPSTPSGGKNIYLYYGNTSATSASTAWNIAVYALQDGTTECTSRIKPFLDAAGFITTTCGINEYSYSGISSVNLSSYNVIMLINGASYSQAMPIGGQSQLYTEVNTNGKGLIVFEWSAYENYDNRWRILDRTNGNESFETVTRTVTHPVTDNLPSTWTINSCGFNIGTGRGTAVVTGSLSNHTVVVGNLGSGRIVNFAITPGYGAYNCWDTNSQMLLKNSIKWLGRPYVSPEPIINEGIEQTP